MTVKEYVTAQKGYNDRQATAIDSAVASAGGLQSDINAHLAKIKELQDSAGQVTDEDQVLIDEILAGGEALSTKAEALATALSTLDAQHPPTPPPTPA